MDISIVILNYKSKNDTLNCIKSIKKSDFGNLTYEIIVVDNNSNDNIGKILISKYSDINFIQNKNNLGMGAGNNVGIKKAKGKYVVIMNPDTIVFKSTFKKLYDFMENNSQTGIVGPLQYNIDKTIQNSCYRWHNLLTPLYRRTFLGKFKFGKKDLYRFLMKDFKHNTEKKVDWLLGSFLFCRASIFKKIGLFDERFFMYFEDTDLCRRAHKEGFNVAYYPKAKIIHNHKRQSAKNKWYKFFMNKMARSHIISWLKYLLKWGIKKEY